MYVYVYIYIYICRCIVKGITVRIHKYTYSVQYTLYIYHVIM